MKQNKLQHGIVLMLGTSFDTMGGVSAVARLLSESRLFADHGVVYIATHRDGNRALKLRTGMRAWLRCVFLLAGGRVRLLHVHLSSYASFWRKSCFIVPAVLAGTPVVLQVHGGDFVNFHERLSSLGKAFVRWIFRRSTVLIALSDEWKRRLQVIAGHSRIEVVSNPVLIPPPRKPQFRKHCTLLFLGNIGRLKGCYVLLAALAAVKSTFPDVRLLCGGDGDHASFLRDAAKRGLQDNVQLLGWVTGPAKRRLLARSTLFVLPSYAEGLPMALLEAMAAGMPIVSTPVGGIPDAVRDGIDGVLVPPGDAPALAHAIERLLSDDRLRESLGTSARARAIENYGVDQVVDRLESIYGHAIESATPRHQSSISAS